MNNKREWQQAPLNEATDFELACFLGELNIGMSKPEYELGVIADNLKDKTIHKYDVITYLEDFENQDWTKEELLKNILEWLHDETDEYL